MIRKILLSSFQSSPSTSRTAVITNTTTNHFTKKRSNVIIKQQEQQYRRSRSYYSSSSSHQCHCCCNTAATATVGQQNLTTTSSSSTSSSQSKNNNNNNYNNNNDNNKDYYKRSYSNYYYYNNERRIIQQSTISRNRNTLCRDVAVVLWTNLLQIQQSRKNKMMLNNSFYHHRRYMSSNNTIPITANTTTTNTTNTTTTKNSNEFNNNNIHPSLVSLWDQMEKSTQTLANILLLTTNNMNSKDDNDNNNTNEQKIKTIRLQRRIALSRAITLMESKHPEKRLQADYLLTYLLTKINIDQTTSGINTTTTSTPTPTFRIGFAGPPGAGKSTFIEAFGKYILDELRTNNNNNIPSSSSSTMSNSSSTTTSSTSSSSTTTTATKIPEHNQLAVVCIDPSSSISGGSILGDKTRMNDLSKHEYAYVRPSANSGLVGGLAMYTDDVVQLCHIAGYPLVFVETVGIGQSELDIIQSVDMVIVVLPPASGDELQGLKRGIIEIADLLVITKADGSLIPAANTTATEYQSALRYYSSSISRNATSKNYNQHNNKTNNNNDDIPLPPPPYYPSVVVTSSKTGKGMDKVWDQICKFYTSNTQQQQQQQNVKESKTKTNNGDNDVSLSLLQQKRQEQAMYWMWKHFQTMILQEQELIQQRNPKLAQRIQDIKTSVQNNSTDNNTNSSNDDDDDDDDGHQKQHITPRMAAIQLLEEFLNHR